MKRKKIDSFTLFVILLLTLTLTLLGMLLAGMKEEKRQFTVLLPLGDLTYDEDFLQKAKKIKGIKEIDITDSKIIEDYNQMINNLKEEQIFAENKEELEKYIKEQPMELFTQIVG